jgi:hypothetical protein
MSLMFDPGSSLSKDIKSVRMELQKTETKVSTILENIALTPVSDRKFIYSWWNWFAFDFEL